MHSKPADRESPASVAINVVGIPNILLDLPLLPAGRRITELGRKHVVVRHRLEADIDLTLFAAADAIDCGAHVVINSTRRHAAKDPEAVPVSVEQHLMGLQQVGSDQKGSAMGQLDMRDLQLRPLAADDGIVLAPIELECFAGSEDRGTNMPRPAIC